MIFAQQLHHPEVKQDSYWLPKEDRCVLTGHFILSDHVNAFPSMNVHEEHGGLLSGVVTEVNPIDLRNSKTSIDKTIYEGTESGMV